jgi:hypothetical protein
VHLSVEWTERIQNDKSYQILLALSASETDAKNIALYSTNQQETSFCLFSQCRHSKRSHQLAFKEIILTSQPDIRSARCDCHLDQDEDRMHIEKKFFRTDALQEKGMGVLKYITIA